MDEQNRKKQHGIDLMLLYPYANCPVSLSLPPLAFLSMSLYVCVPVCLCARQLTEIIKTLCFWRRAPRTMAFTE